MSPKREREPIVSVKRNERPPAGNGATPGTLVLSIVIPTKNEAENVAELLARVQHATATIAAEVIFVDDSTDHTPESISQVSKAGRLPASLIHRPPERRANGLAGAVTEGIRAARGQWVCVMDADLQHPPELIPQLLDTARATESDIVVASRYTDGGEPTGLGPLRLLTSRFCILAARLFFPKRLRKVSDPLSGYFIFRREAVDPQRLRPRGFKILLETLVRFPHLSVSEVPFRLLDRHSGQSKAALREGLQYLMLLLGLRVSGTLQRLTRFSLVGASGLVVNQLLLVAFTDLAGLHYLLSAAPATLGSTLWNFSLTEAWVFSDRREGRSSLQRVGPFILVNIGALVLRGPFLVILTSGLGVHYLLSNLITLLALALARYALSDRWIWAERLSSTESKYVGKRDAVAVSWQWLSRTPRPVPDYLGYDIHGIVRIASEVRLPELDYFRSPSAPVQPDLRITIGGPSSPAVGDSKGGGDHGNGFQYKEFPGSLGFWVQITPGESSSVVASPLLKHSPHVLYTNVVEPMLRWMLVEKGYALVHAACVALDGKAVLVTAPTDTGKTTTILRLLTQDSFAFLSDDMIILGRDGRLLCYPKPLTISRHTLEAVNGAALSRRQRLALQVQSRLHSKSGRLTALMLARMPLPMASINAVVQMLVPPPKYTIERLIPGVQIGREAVLSHMVAIERGPDLEISLDPALAEQTLLKNCEDAYGFPPYASLERFLHAQNGLDLRSKERDIIGRALDGCAATLLRSQRRDWWERLPVFLRGINGNRESAWEEHSPSGKLKLV